MADRDLCSTSADGTVRLWRMDNPAETAAAAGEDSDDDDDDDDESQNKKSKRKRKKRKKKKKKKLKNPLQVGTKDGVPIFKAAVALRHPLQVLRDVTCVCACVARVAAHASCMPD